MTILAKKKISDVILQVEYTFYSESDSISEKILYKDTVLRRAVIDNDLTALKILLENGYYRPRRIFRSSDAYALELAEEEQNYDALELFFSIGHKMTATEIECVIAKLKSNQPKHS